MTTTFAATLTRAPGQASASVRLATLPDEDLLWELGMLHAARVANGADVTDADVARTVELETEYLRRHPLHEVLPGQRMAMVF